MGIYFVKCYELGEGVRVVCHYGKLEKSERKYLLLNGLNALQHIFLGYIISIHFRWEAFPMIKIHPIL